MQLTPGVTIVQGPDGDEISVNGQKGITNNIAVDGADFNNPFFGEQRGGQRPAFTFNQDAVKEMVVVADGARRSSAAAAAGFVNVVTKSGTNDDARHRALRSPRTTVDRVPKNSDGRDEVPSTSSSSAPRSAGRCGATGCSTSWPTTSSSSARPSRSIPRASSQRSSSSSRRSGSPNENGPIERTNDARVFLGKIDCADQPGEPVDAPLQLHVERAAERHLRRRLVGPERQRDRAGILECRVGVAAVDDIEHDC